MKENPMKTNNHPGPWALRSVTRNDGRRVITLWRTPSWCDDPRLNAKSPLTAQLRSRWKVSIRFAPADLSGFEVPIRRRPPARRRAPSKPKRQALNPL